MARRLAAVVGLAVLLGAVVGVVGRVSDGAGGGTGRLEVTTAPREEPSDGPDRAGQGRDLDAAGPDGKSPANDHFRLFVHFVSPMTLDDTAPGYELTIADHPVWAASPDGSLFAAAQGSVYSPEVTIDVLATDRSSVRRVTRDFGDPIPHLDFSAESDALLWVTDDPWHPRLHRLSLEVLYDHTTTPLPTGAEWWTWQALSGGRVGAFAFLTPADGGEPTAHVVVADPAEGKVLSTVALADLPAPWKPLADPDDELPVAQSYEPGLAWDVTRQRLYVAYAHSDALAVVDLAAGRVVETVDLAARAGHAPADPAARPSLRTRLAAWLVPAAHAGGMYQRGVTRVAALSPDGRRLYLSGTRHTVDQPEHGPPLARSAPLGLRVVDTATLQVAGEVDLPVNSVAVSPDGRLLASQEPWLDEEQAAARLWSLDPAALTPDEVAVRGDVWFSGFSADGRYAYLDRWDDREPVVEVLDLDTGEVVAERAGHYASAPEAGILLRYAD